MIRFNLITVDSLYLSLLNGKNKDTIIIISLIFLIILGYYIVSQQWSIIERDLELRDLELRKEREREKKLFVENMNLKLRLLDKERESTELSRSSIFTRAYKYIKGVVHSMFEVVGQMLFGSFYLDIPF